MARFELRIKASAAKELAGIATRADRRRVVQRIRRLADDPRPPGCKKLSRRELYRVRQGVYRIVYTVEDRQLVVQVVRIAHRRDVYRAV